MNAFEYLRPKTVDEAIAMKATSGASFLAGGTNLLDLVKSDIEHPSAVIDINGLDLEAISSQADGTLRIGALARNSDMAAHALIRSRYPLLVKAIVSGASPQVRNMATAGGNLLQRTRCHYFVDPVFSQCNKKNENSGCAALHGWQHQHAIFGASKHCIAVHPSDMAVALCALNAIVRVIGLKGERSIPIADFHRLPGDHPARDTTLAADELIVSIDLPARGFADHFEYLKVRDRASFAFALVSAAVALDFEEDVVTTARIALGGVAPKPWRVSATEQELVGRRLSGELLRDAAHAAVADATVHPGNAYKKALVPRVIERALRTAGGLHV